MVVLAQPEQGVEPGAYERWAIESYAPAVGKLPSVSDWRNHRITGLPGSDAEPPYGSVVTLEVEDPGRLGRDVSGETMRQLLVELHEYAEVTQLMSERYA